MDLSISNSFSKETQFEKTELSAAYFKDLKSRKVDAISNERIQNGDIILDTYEVTSDAISGGMGSVWRVHHNSWNTDLAMKRPQPRFFAEGSEGRKEQFIKECEHWINLGLHPNIVSCYYVRDIGGVPTIFSEWMDGGSLYDCIKDGSLYEGTEKEVQERILDIAIQAARGLQYSHESGLIHQDFKPGNLLLTKDWDAKVADFGLAKAKSKLDDKSDTAKTTGYTLAYCPKEQSDGEEPERWMDVYSWALTVLEMYAGKRLWQTGAEAKEHFDEYLTQCVYPVPGKLSVILEESLNDQPDGFKEIGNRLLEIYFKACGDKYARPQIKTLDSPESINNKALSFIDLGNTEYAERLLEIASRKRWSGYNYAKYNHANIWQVNQRDVYENPIRQIGKHTLPYDDPGWLLLRAEQRNRYELEELLEKTQNDLPEEIEAYIPEIKEKAIDAEEIRVKEYPAQAGVLTPSGKEILIVSKGSSPELLLIDADTGEMIREFPVPEEHPLENIECLLLSEDGESVYLIGGEDYSDWVQQGPGKKFHEHHVRHRLYRWRFSDGSFVDALEGPTLRTDNRTCHHRARCELKDDRFLYVKRDFLYHKIDDRWINRSQKKDWVWDLSTGKCYYDSQIHDLIQDFDSMDDFPRPELLENSFASIEFAIPGHADLIWRERVKTRYTDLTGDHGWYTGEICEYGGFPRMLFHARQFSFDKEKTKLLVSYDKYIELYPLDQPFTRFRAPFLLCEFTSVMEDINTKESLDAIKAEVAEKVKARDVAGAMELLQQARPYADEGYALEVAAISAQISAVGKPVKLHSMKNTESEYFSVISEQRTGHSQTVDGKRYSVLNAKSKRAGRNDPEWYEVCGNVNDVSYFEEAPFMFVDKSSGDICRHKPPYLVVSNSNTGEWIADYPLPGELRSMVFLPGGSEALAVIDDEKLLPLDPEFRYDTYTSNFSECVRNKNVKPKEVKYKVRQAYKVATCLKLYSMDLNTGEYTEIGRGFAGVNHREKHSTQRGLGMLDGKLTFKNRFDIRLSTDSTGTEWQHMIDTQSGEEIDRSHAHSAAMSDDGRYLIINGHLMILDWDWAEAPSDMTQKIGISYDIDKYMRFAEEKKNVRFLRQRSSSVQPENSGSVKQEKQSEKKGLFSRMFKKK